MSSSWTCATLLLLISLRTLRGTPSLSLSLTSPVDVISGNAICSNTTVEFTCNGRNVETFGWKINDMPIESWYIPTTSSGVQVEERGHFEIKLYLNITNGEPRTVSSRLVGRVDQGLYNGDEISCIDTSTATEPVSQSLNLSYSLVTGQSPPAPGNFTIKLHSMNRSSHRITFTNWDLAFSVRHAIESYNITPAETTFNDTVLVLCPVLCPAYEPCVCNITGQLPMEGINMNITAVNCNGQEGPANTTTVFPKACQTEALGKSESLSNQTDSICQHSSTGSVIIPHGVACYNGTISGSIVSYHCDDGFTIDNVGNTNRVCLSDGNWSGEEPECLAKGNHVCDICYKIYVWMIALVIVSLLIWIVSSILIIVWSILYRKLFLWPRVIWKISMFGGVLVVAVTLQLAVIIVLSMFMDTVRTQSSPFITSRSSLVIASIVLSILALLWVTTMCLASIMYSYYRSDPDDHIKIERENELYYLGRSLRSNYPEEPSYSLRKESDQETIAANVDDIYDKISHNSDIMDDREILDDSFTDSEGYIRTTRQQLHGVMIMEGITEDNEVSLSYCV